MTDFVRAEYESRQKRIGKLMSEAGVDLLLVTSDENFRYFTSGRSLVTWGSFTRPVFAVIDGENPPVILTHQSLEEATRSEGFYSQVFSYADITKSPTEQLKRILLSLSPKGGRMGIEGGLEQRIGLPFLHFQEFLESSKSVGFETTDASDLIWDLRIRKSELEVECMKQAGSILARARQRIFSTINAGMTERRVANALSASILEEGADEVAFVHVNSGKLHTWYPTDKKILPGELVYLDAGATVRGYTCEYDRIATVGPPTQIQRDLHEAVCDIAANMKKHMREGVRCSEVFDACNRMYSRLGLPTEKWGRAGHGQGLLATELPSIASHEKMVLSSGMTVSNEPGIINEHGVFVWEDVYAIHSSAPVKLSIEPGELMQISA